MNRQFNPLSKTHLGPFTRKKEWLAPIPTTIGVQGGNPTAGQRGRVIAPSHHAAFFQDNADTFELPILTDKKLCQIRYVEFKLQEDVASSTWHHSVIGFVFPAPKPHHATNFH